MAKTSPNGYEIEETAPGHIDIKCARSKRPYTRVTPLGMFCDLDDCQCEKDSKALMSSLFNGSEL